MHYKCGKIQNFVLLKMKQFIPWTKNIEQKLVVKTFLGPLKLCFSFNGIYLVYAVIKFQAFWVHNCCITLYTITYIRLCCSEVILHLFLISYPVSCSQLTHYCPGSESVMKKVMESGILATTWWMLCCHTWTVGEYSEKCSKLISIHYPTTYIHSCVTSIILPLKQLPVRYLVF